ncbi:MAG: response regulator [Rhodopila sp.]
MVEDNPHVRETMADQLVDLSFATLVASSGNEALAMIEAGANIDALVSDLSMPGLTGV